MDTADELKRFWLSEEAHAFSGWDFSHLDGRWRSGRCPWDFAGIIAKYLRPRHRLLDMGTGGGEFLLTLNHPPENTSVTEGWEPNVRLCRQKLQPMGITVRQVFPDDRLDFPDGSFDIVINRHESYDLAEVRRVLRGGGLFITQQVGEFDTHSLCERLIPGFVPPFPGHSVAPSRRAFERAGLRVLDSGEAFFGLDFFDCGAIAFFAKICPWQFVGFSVEKMLPQLMSLHRDIERDGMFSTAHHRFFIVAGSQTSPDAGQGSN